MHNGDFIPPVGLGPAGVSSRVGIVRTRLNYITDKFRTASSLSSYRNKRLYTVTH